MVIERLQPQIDDGRFPIKRTVGEAVFATADVFADGHDRLAGVLKYRREGGDWQEVPLAPLGDDAWGATFVVSELGEYEYTFEAWIDRFGSWLAGLVAWADAGEDVVHGEEGADRVDGTGAVSGWLGRLRRAFDFTLMDQLVDFAAYERALRDGRAVVMVHVHGDKPKAEAHAILKRHGAHFTNYYGRFATEELDLWRGPEPEIPGYLRR